MITQPKIFVSKSVLKKEKYAVNNPLVYIDTTSRSVLADHPVLLPVIIISHQLQKSSKKKKKRWPCFDSFPAKTPVSSEDMNPLQCLCCFLTRPYRSSMTTLALLDGHGRKMASRGWFTHAGATAVNQDMGCKLWQMLKKIQRQMECFPNPSSQESTENIWEGEARSKKKPGH